ncbi:hypothetical protein [Niabella aquatica]
MMYHYLAFGIPVISEIELPALLPLKAAELMKDPVYVKLGAVPKEIPGAVQATPFTRCTANELSCIIPGKIKLYVSDGREIIMEPVNADYQGQLIYIYNTALTAILLQRNLVSFHVSGVFTGPGKVALFAADSGTGKSTLAVKLQELGYAPFTDDTAVLYIENGKCYAQASYPMMRLWEKTIVEQTLLNEDEKQKVYADDQRPKYGFSFHSTFTPEPAEVVQIIFLKKEGTEIQITPIKNAEAFTALSNNVFGARWTPAMQKTRLQFNIVSQVLNKVPCIRAIRPENRDSFTEFSVIIKKILQNDFVDLICG